MTTYVVLLPSHTSHTTITNARQTIGSIRTHSANNFVTDSAAAATAYGSGIKTNNRHVGTNPDGEAVANILEAAKLAGFRTGLVATSTIYDATPAGFSGHVTDRGDSGRLTAQQIGYAHPLGPVVDLMLGGGRCKFMSKTTPGNCRDDDIDLLGFAKDKGWAVSLNRDEFDTHLGNGTELSLPYIGLFDERTMLLEVDRAQTNAQPSLLEMSRVAISSLTRATEDAEKGFFLMIEASRIDHAGHDNDPVSILHDGIMYNQVMDHVKEYIGQHPDTVLISAADHETGGLTLLPGHNPYRMKEATASGGTLHIAQMAYDGTDMRGFVVDSLLPRFALEDATEEEIDELVASGIDDWKPYLVGMMSKRVGVSWGTFEHTSVDVGLVAYAKGCLMSFLKRELAGGHDNTEITPVLARLLGVDLEEATRKLRAAGQNGWMGPGPIPGPLPGIL